MNILRIFSKVTEAVEKVVPGSNPAQLKILLQFITYIFCTGNIKDFKKILYCKTFYSVARVAVFEGIVSRDFEWLQIIY